MRGQTYERSVQEYQGAFPCGECGVIISPEDRTKNVYRVLEVGVKNHALYDLLIECNKCGSETRLTDFCSENEEMG